MELYPATATADGVLNDQPSARMLNMASRQSAYERARQARLAAAQTTADATNASLLRNTADATAVLVAGTAQLALAEQALDQRLASIEQKVAQIITDTASAIQQLSGDIEALAAAITTLQSAPQLPPDAYRSR